MNGLVLKDMSGNFQLKGLAWQDLHSCNLPKESRDAIYMAICKLMDYEASGLTPDQVEHLVDDDLK